MNRNREEEIRKGTTKIGEDAGRPEGQDRRPLAQAERDVAAAKNPVGNGQGDAQADDPNNEMNASEKGAQGGHHRAASRDQIPRKP
jgi:hypothetical protein